VTAFKLTAPDQITLSFALYGPSRARGHGDGDTRSPARMASTWPSARDEPFSDSRADRLPESLVTA